MIVNGPLNPTFVITGQVQERDVLFVVACIRNPCCLRPPLAVAGTSIVTLICAAWPAAIVRFDGAVIHESLAGPNAVQSN